MAKKNTDKIVFDHIKVLDAAAKGVSVAKAPDEKVILCSVLPPFDFPWATGLQPAEMVVSLNKSIKNMRCQLVFCLDYYSVMVNEQKGLNSIYSNDGVHPNKAGFQAINPLVEKAIAKVLLKK